jgi:hypothetical protein
MCPLFDVRDVVKPMVSLLSRNDRLALRGIMRYPTSFTKAVNMKQATSETPSQQKLPGDANSEQAQRQLGWCNQLHSTTLLVSVAMIIKVFSTSP